MSKIENIKKELAAVQAAMRQHDAAQNEGAEGFNPLADQEQALIGKLLAAEQADIDERFDALREAWNEAVAKRGGPSRIKFPDVLAIEKEVGIKLRDLQAAKARREAASK